MIVKLEHHHKQRRVRFLVIKCPGLKQSLYYQTKYGKSVWVETLPLYCIMHALSSNFSFEEDQVITNPVNYSNFFQAYLSDKITILVIFESGPITLEKTYQNNMLVK